MKITREEFKELVDLHKKAYDNFIKYSGCIDESLLDELIFPVINWVAANTGLYANRDNNGEPIDFDVLYDLYSEGETPIGITNAEEEGKFILDFSSDLDVIYDRFVDGYDNSQAQGE